MQLISFNELTVLRCAPSKEVPGACTIQEVMEDEKLQPLPIAKLEQCEDGEWHYLEGHE